MESNTKQSARIGTMRQMGSAQARASILRGSSGPKPTWIDQFKPTTNHLRPDVVQIIKASYPTKVKGDNGELVDQVFPWWPWVLHYDAQNKASGVCSAGPWHGNKKRAKPCRGCDLFFSMMQKDPLTGKNKMGPVSKRDMYSFSVIHYHPYHLVEALNQDGTVRVNQKTGEPFWQHRICELENCQYCAENKRVLPAYRLHWDAGHAHWNKLLERDEMLRRCCKHCGGRNTISWAAHVCANPECEHPFFEHGRTNIREEDISKAVADPMLCPRCGTFAWPVEYDTCSVCGDQCQPSSIFDVRLHVHRTAEEGRNGTELSIDDWEEAYSGILVPPEIIRYSQQMADEMLLPMDLPKILAPTPMEKQMKLYGAGGRGSSGSGRQPVATEYGSNTAS